MFLLFLSLHYLVSDCFIRQKNPNRPYSANYPKTVCTNNFENKSISFCMCALLWLFHTIKYLQAFTCKVIFFNVTLF